MVAAIVVASILCIFTLIVLLAGRNGRLVSGRFARLLHVGGLSARMSTSFVGVKLRRLFAGRERKKRIDAAARKANAERVAQTMGQMKGAMMKLGQMMSFVTDEIPEEYRSALAMLQAEAPPMEFALLRDVAETDLEMPLERAFARFDEKPLASASIGQVHRARLPTGEEVVVKIQYPGVAEAIQGDLANVGLLYRMMGMFYPTLEPKPVVDELRGRIGEELDYAHEARSQQAFCDLYKDHPFIHVPRVIASRSSARVLTSEWVEGRKWAQVIEASEAERQRIAETLYRFIFGSITRYGVFNGDPHPGNYLFQPDGKVVFLDFGCVKYFPVEMRRNWRALQASHIAGDRRLFRDKLVSLGFFRADSEISADLIYDYFTYFYEPFTHDREFTYTREYNARSFGMVFKPSGPFAGLAKKLNMPRDFVFVNRIQWGVVSLLAQLGARNNWHRIHQELLFDGPPSTELGHLDHAWREKWRHARGLSDAKELALTHDGVVRIA